MKHSIYITPLNCSYDIGVNEFIKCDKDEYDALNSRGIYCKNVLSSYFKMKSVGTNLTPYLEPAVYGVSVGDIITIEFDALLVSGMCPPNFGIRYIKIDENGVDQSTSWGEYIPDNSLDTYFKHFKIPFVITPNFSGNTGILLNIRSQSTTEHEMVIKNVLLTVETDNLNFRLENNMVEYKCEKDYLKSINYVCQTPLIPSINNIKNLIDNGKITFADNSMSIAGTSTSGIYKGLGCMLSVPTYSTPYVAYIEYTQTSGNNIGVFVQEFGNDDSKITTEQKTDVPYQSSVRKKGIFYFKGNIGEKRNVFINVGRTNVEFDITFHRVIFCCPRFDDENKIPPNDLFELFPNKFI